MESLLKNILKINIKDIKEVHLGLSNNHYIVNDIYFVRVPKKTKRPDYSPKQEALIEESIGAIFHPSIDNLYFDKENGIKISNLISDFTTFDNQNIIFTHIRRIADCLRKFHSSNIAGINKFNVKEKIKQYKTMAKTASLLKEEEIIKQYEQYENDELVLCHNDLVPGNILFINHKVELIDYEYASLNDPYFDLASFLSENNITDEIVIKFFLEQYFKEPIKEEQYKKLHAFINLNNLLWYYWALMMYEIDKQTIYLEIAKEKKENLEK